MEPAIKKLSSTPEDGLASSPEPTTAHVQDDPANSPKPIAADVEPIRARADPITLAEQGTSGTAPAPQMAAGRSPVRKNTIRSPNMPVRRSRRIFDQEHGLGSFNIPISYGRLHQAQTRAVPKNPPH
ncbi:uncharacterized protein PGTG_07302 [Puccinia graminis f. sp. tritici CRL 75-36-700-3]|uniref:Uncharacterized protein n=1 Tax=Puccinia graminis f. sp. tritici (strain CRL 75-36-700-3 / race SCCL) TaxID=418459 RepID=E3K9A0_PUCGT|nr:uncharacterized protein PGTG_07302 [Puccinia graminis f. sp. tritici CRL 75-36-700-3]EFP81050.2 hypothetical protein PGTG_07302 [Puccinia graminis f. sp. tritici CRL 75-36-700-3]